jgi:hypothetical protein
VVRRLARTVTGEVVIRRPIHDVYSFCRKFANLPRFRGNVVVLKQLLETGHGDDTPSAAGPDVSGRPGAPSGDERGTR